MTVCIVTHKLIRSDGQGRINAEVVACLAWRGHKFDVIASEIEPALAALENVRWHRIPPARWLPSNLFKYQVFAIKARRALRSLVAHDIIQLNGAIVHGTRGGVNVAMFVHSDWITSPHHPAHGGLTPTNMYQSIFTRFNAWWERRAFRRAERVVALSNQVRDSLIEKAGVNRDIIQVIEPGVDSEQFRPRNPREINVLRSELGLGADVFILFFTGDIRSNRKNLDLVLHAMAKLGTNFHLAVAGDPAWSPYPAMATSLGIEKRVHFLGRRTHDLPALMRGADVFAFPSHYDPFALVVTEAMASGLVVITVASVGASALIESGKNGYVLPNADDPQSLVALLNDLVLDRPKCRAIANAGRKAAEGLSWEFMADRYEAVYEQIIAERTPAASRNLNASPAGG